MKRGVLALALCFCLCGCGLLPEKAWESVRADFDGDGVEERFELRLDGEELQLWFAGAGKEQRLGEEGLIQYTPEQQQNLRLLWLSQQKRAVACEVARSATSSSSVVYIVEAGQPVQIPLDGVSDLQQEGPGSFTGRVSMLDAGYMLSEGTRTWMGRTAKPYWFYWDGEGFVQDSARQLDWESLAAWEGLQEQITERLQQRQQDSFPKGFVEIDGEKLPARWEVREIWLRDNRILTVNVGYDYSSSRQNGAGGREYDTYLLEEGKIQLLDTGGGFYEETAPLD